MKATLLLLFLFIVVGLSAELTFEVTYTGFNAEQQAAFQAGLAIWQPLLDAAYPVKINARFAPLTGYALVTIPNLTRNFAGAPQTNVWYPTALANTLGGVVLNPEEADVDFFINSSDPWYFGVDGNCPVTQYDFVSQIMKAVPYGLGYMSSFYISAGYGSYGMLNPSAIGLTTSFVWEPMQNQPVIYDTFIVNGSSQYLTDTANFTNPSPALATQLTGGNLQYYGSEGVANNGGQPPVLYASAFNLARTARLLDGTYQGTENVAGVPTSYMGVVLRNPAPIVLGMLEDMGWDVLYNTLRLPVTDLTATLEGNEVTLDWGAPDTYYDIVSYNLFRNDIPLDQTTELSYSDSDLTPGNYTYAVRVRYSFGISAYSNPVVVTVVTANEDNISIPVANMGLQIAPNPFGNRAEISYRLEKAARVQVNIYNAKGNKVYDRDLGYASAGIHSKTLDDLHSGQHLPDGIYFVRLRADGQTTVKKVLIVR